MLKEEEVKLDDNKSFYRTVIKTKSKEPVTYAVKMDSVDWLTNIAHAYHSLSDIECKSVPGEKDVIECFMEVTPEKPITGWQLKPGAYGIHRAHRVIKPQPKPRTTPHQNAAK